MENNLTIKFFESEFIEFTINRITDFLSKLKLEKENEQNTSFIKREPTPLLVYKTIDEKKADIKRALQELTKNYPSLIDLEANMIKTIKEIESSKNALQLLDNYLSVTETENKYLKLKHPPTDDNVFVWANKDAVFLSLEKFENNITEAEGNNINILSNIISLNEKLRAKQRQPSLDESVLIQLGYRLLEKSQHIPRKFQYLGTYGFRDIQTFLSLADPGEGHINITTQSEELLKGLVVHIEHIDRDKETDKERVEAYRLPSPIHIAKVRLHVGDSTPSTVYVGRPMFENLQTVVDNTTGEISYSNPYFKTDILKSVHYTAAICNKMFSLGIADCKIAIERMTFLQSVEFMKALVGNCQRDVDLQFLSAAFNINTPIVDDRDPDNIVRISNKFEVAKLGIEIASLTGFNKVTWDGASKEVPSRSIIKLKDDDLIDRGQLTSIQILELVHLAHEKGLETYISAGMKNEHMKPATYTSVDGVGIGTSLHYKTPDATINGALNKSAIMETLRIRNESETEVRGRGAKILATLDRLHFEGNLSGDEELKRIQLFKALISKDEESIAKNSELTASIISKFIAIHSDHPVKERALRKIEFLKSKTSATNSLQVHNLEKSLKSGNILTIKNLL